MTDTTTPTTTPHLCTDAERAQLTSHACPDCGKRLFRRGPTGGLAVNIECINCFARFNVTKVSSGFVAFAQRIERLDQGGSEWPDRGLW